MTKKNSLALLSLCHPGATHSLHPCFHLTGACCSKAPVGIFCLQLLETEGSLSWLSPLTVLTRPLISYYKSSGVDDIIVIVLQKGKHALILILHRICRAGLTLEFVSIQWRHIKVIFILKPGKDCYFKLESFRSIILMSLCRAGIL